MSTKQIFNPLLDNRIEKISVPTFLGQFATDPTGTFSGGETYFNTALNTTMVYDPSRGKWLSQTSILYGFSRNGNTAPGSYFNMTGGILMSPGLTGYPTFSNATLVGVQLSRTDADAVSIEVMQDAVVLDGISLGAGIPAGSQTLNVDITDPAILTVRVKPATNIITDASGAFLIRLRV